MNACRYLRLAAAHGRRLTVVQLASKSVVCSESYAMASAWWVQTPRHFAKLAPTDLFATASELIRQAKELPDEQATPLLIEAGTLLEKACCDEMVPDGRACVRLGRWHVLGLGDCDVDLTRAWQLLLKGHQLTNDPEAAYWLGWIAANGHTVRETVGKPPAEGGCGKPGGCGCVSSDLCVFFVRSVYCFPVY